jgi:hypothetical protein
MVKIKGLSPNIILYGDFLSLKVLYGRQFLICIAVEHAAAQSA